MFHLLSLGSRLAADFFGFLSFLSVGWTARTDENVPHG
jgi:hypothetical protein